MNENNWSNEKYPRFPIYAGMTNDAFLCAQVGRFRQDASEEIEALKKRVDELEKRNDQQNQRAGKLVVTMEHSHPMLIDNGPLLKWFNNGMP